MIASLDRSNSFGPSNTHCAPGSACVKPSNAPPTTSTQIVYGRSRSQLPPVHRSPRCSTTGQPRSRTSGFWQERSDS